MILILQILVGIGLLLFGRKLFWFFVGGVGFIAASEIAAGQLAAQPDWVIVLIALGVGLIGALLAVFFQMGAIAFAGLLGGGYLGLLAVHLLKLSNQTSEWIGLIIGAVVGLVLMVAFFGFALIALSSLIGSFILVESVDLAGWWYWIVAAVLALCGIVFQLNQKQGVDGIKHQAASG